MCDGNPFRLAFLDSEPSSAACHANEDGHLELVNATEADPDRVDGVVVDVRPEMGTERISNYLRAGVAVYSCRL